MGEEITVQTVNDAKQRGVETSGSTARSDVREDKCPNRKYLLDRREIYIVGVNFDSEKGNLIGWEEEKTAE